MNKEITKVCRIAIVCGASLFLTACSSQFRVTRPAAKPFNTFTQVEVCDFSTALNQSDPLDEEARSHAQTIASGISGEVNKRLAKRHLFQKAVLQPERMIIEGRVISYQPGSQALRYFVGFGAGTGHVIMEVTFRAEDKSVVGQIEATAVISGGLFGGSVDQVVNPIAGAIEDFIDQNYTRVKCD